MVAYVKAHAATELAEGLRLNLFMKSPFDPVEDYTVHEITLGHGCNVRGYAGTTIGYISTLPVSQAKDGPMSSQELISILIR